MNMANVTAFPGNGTWSSLMTTSDVATYHEVMTNVTNATGWTGWGREVGHLPGRGGVPHFPISADVNNVYFFLNKVMPAALTLGIIGNAVAACVFMLTPLKKTPLSHYLTALAISEIIYEVASCVLWASFNGWNIYGKVGVCQVTTFSLFMSRFLIVWYLLSAHFERLLLHFGRPGTKRWCTVFRTKCIILTVFIFSLVAFLHYVWSHVVTPHSESMTCRPMTESIPHMARLRKVELVLALFLPMLVMLGMDVALIYKVITRTLARRSRRTSSTSSTRLSLRSKGGNSGGGGGGGSSHRSSTKYCPPLENGQMTAFNGPRENGPSEQESERVRAARNLDLSSEKTSSTLVCIIAGVIFMVLTLPSACLNAKALFAPQVEGGVPLTPYEQGLMHVFEQIVLLNSAYKVFFYASMLRNFRRALLHMCKACVRRSRPARPRPSVTTV